MTLPANIRVNTKVNFPARVNVSGPLGLNKSNGVWSFFLSLLGLSSPPSSINLQALLVLAQSPTSGVLYAMTASQIYGLGVTVARAVAAGSTYAVQSTDGDIVVKTGSGATTLNLFSSAAATRDLSFKDGNGAAGTSAITINAAGGDTIDGQSSVSISTDWGALTLYPLPGGGGWYIK